MAAVGFHILILVTLRVPVVAQVDGALVEEVGLSHTHPIEFRFAAEKAGRLLGEVGVVLDLLGERLVATEALAQVQTGGEETVVVELRGIEETDGEGVAATHRQATDSAVGTVFQRAVVGIDIVDDIHETLGDGGNGRCRGTRAGIAEARGIHAP